MVSEACSQLWLAAPITLSNLLERTQYWVTLTLVGALGPDILGPVALASSVNNVVGTSVAIGLSMATATLSSQAAGARDAKALSLVLQRAMPINLVFSIPCMLLLLTLRPILVGGLGMDEDFGARAGVYGLTVLPVAALTGILRCQQVWLVSQGRPRPAMFVQLSMMPVHALLSYVLVRHSALGYAGAGVAMSLSMLARVSALHAYIANSVHTRAHWGGFSRSALSGWGSYLALALPGVAMLSEYWIGEIIMLAAARLPSPQVALSALSLYMLVNTTCYQPPNGIRMAINARVGNFLGGGQPLRARSTFRVGVLLVAAWLPVPAALLLSLAARWGFFFTTDMHVVGVLAAATPILACYISFDALLAVANGTLAGCGLQKIGGRLALVCYVGVSLPTALALAFGAGGDARSTDAKSGVLALASGHALGKALHAISSLAVVAFSVKWEVESERAVARVNRLSELPAAKAVAVATDRLDLLQDDSAKAGAQQLAEDDEL